METKEEVNAKKVVYGKNKALELLEGASKLFVAKGKKVLKFDLKREKPDDETLRKMILGPTGNLRAPTLRKGKTLVVGFNAEMYQDAGF